uniref:Uncharacterized protein n=1 Tax=Anopheles coluzzii TaxID=1518534 RepID=A0A8W7PBU1_ANOCL
MPGGWRPTYFALPPRIPCHHERCPSAQRHENVRVRDLILRHHFTRSGFKVGKVKNYDSCFLWTARTGRIRPGDGSTGGGYIKERHRTVDDDDDDAMGSIIPHRMQNERARARSRSRRCVVLVVRSVSPENQQESSFTAQSRKVLTDG